ncbi:MAG: HSP20 family protein [Flammeovirgaceae bacterium]|jgi:HSP20 family protein
MTLIKRKENGLFPPSDSLWGDLFIKGPFTKGLELGTSIPAVNIKEAENSFDVEVALPGFNKDDIKITVENNVLTISSKKEEEKEEKDGDKITRREFNYSSFNRSFQIPDNVDDKNIEAAYKDDLLKLILPKSEPSKVESKKQIEIK